MAVDLKSEGGTEILKRLVEWADVVITNFPHGTREAHEDAHSLLDTEDAHEGALAFAEKRAPVWRGR